MKNLTLGFQRKYPEIRVEHSGSAGAQLPPKLFFPSPQRFRRNAIRPLTQRFA
jgi:hypothetical protein